ncbi:hypothetical protein D7S86_02910 [Pararobbsia silviterrae]|uniref:Uncharacterized protein n=1 Tax=Pararobbsia silviterrae TaxID=1792498 RepID=A0A494YAW3_9BURK|nr:hypothetical protein D7S86_02910 [Pararobbsia silviterrae]
MAAPRADWGSVMLSPSGESWEWTSAHVIASKARIGGAASARSRRSDRAAACAMTTFARLLGMRRGTGSSVRKRFRSGRARWTVSRAG